MPIGDYSLPHDDWERIRAFFERLSPILVQFAKDHNIAIDRYYHDAPMWAFRFRHPKGGGASIDVHRVSDHTIRVNKVWYLDVYETFTRHIKSEDSGELPLEQTELVEILEVCLKRVAGWKREDMTPHGGYEKFWSAYTPEEFKVISIGRLPELRL
ncbi:MAG TPA: hypothetical protein VJN89_12675 [Candidatus Acidoferrum sp.]|nr:hypothetical protein [Candidatus Acidoferrum sp.]